MELSNHCSCGCASEHVIAKRLTFDGIAVVLWSTGAVSGRFTALPGVPMRRPRTPTAREFAVTAGHLFLGDVELYDLVELPELYAAAERVAQRGGLPGDVRAEFAAARDAERIPLDFHTTETDARGHWVEQIARPNRLQWPGIVIRRTRAGYEVYSEHRGMVAVGVVSEYHVPTGFRCTNRAELVKYLLSTLNN